MKKLLKNIIRKHIENGKKQIKGGNKMAVALVLLLLYFIAWLIEKSHDYSIESHNRKKNEFEDHDLYRAASGTIRDKKTREYRFVTHIDNDLVTTDGNFNVIKNVSQEQRDREYQVKKRSHSKTETVFNICPHTFDYQRQISGEQYKDYESGAVYVVRRLVDKQTYRNINYYVDIDSLDLVRPIDSFQEKIKEKGYQSLDRDFHEKWETLKMSNVEYIKMCKEIKL